MRRAREFWKLKAIVRKSSPNPIGDGRANGTPVSRADSIVSDEVKRKQISIAIRYVAMARAR